MKGIIGTEYISCFKAYTGKTWYIVQKQINGKSVSFGTCRTLIEALMVRDLCIVDNWEKRYLKRIRCKDSTGEKYIRKIGSTFHIQKWMDGKTVHFGSFKTLEEAILERDLLVKYNWDLEELCDLN